MRKSARKSDGWGVEKHGDGVLGSADPFEKMLRLELSVEACPPEFRDAALHTRDDLYVARKIVCSVFVTEEPSPEAVFACFDRLTRYRIQRRKEAILSKIDDQLQDAARRTHEQGRRRRGVWSL